MGVDAAIRIASNLGKPEAAEWARKKRELDALIRFHCVDSKKSNWSQQAVLPFWQQEFRANRTPVVG